MGLSDLPARGARAAEAEHYWERILAQIPSTFGKLVYVASLRDPNTGTYQHHGMAQVHGEEQTEKTIRESHTRLFNEWLSYGLAEQKGDLELYLSSFPLEKRRILATWSKLTPYRYLVPDSAGEPEKELYLSDLELVLELLRREYHVELADQDA